ncbi:hypothetical protein OSB04_016663 [Centaurea solstitialis]|uniref:Uncharacterized protein n=1 Tax=Centaurea solstitialis TaxID=347529 RepID=A0AA38T924_9ASTR|nr:hypothetical protein OSB04_016663 [Centaurea solstitialis]
MDLTASRLDIMSVLRSLTFKQFLGARLVSWQCKKQTIVSTSTVEVEYVAASSCFSQVLWIQNHMLNYGTPFLNTPIYIDNNMAITIVNNLVLTVHTYNQYADLFTKAFDVGRFTFLITNSRNESTVFVFDPFRTIFLGNNLEIWCFTMSRFVSESFLQTVSSSKFVSSKTVGFGFRDFVSKIVLQHDLEFQMSIKLFRSESCQVLILCDVQKGYHIGWRISKQRF